MYMALGDDESLILLDGAGGTGDLEGGAAVELARFAHGAGGNPQLELVAREDLALGFLAFRTQYPHAFEGSLGTPDGDGFRAGELSGLHEVLGLGELVSLAEEDVEILAAYVDMAVGQVDENFGFGHLDSSLDGGRLEGCSISEIHFRAC